MVKMPVGNYHGFWTQAVRGIRWRVSWLDTVIQKKLFVYDDSRPSNFLCSPKESYVYVIASVMLLPQFYFRDIIVFCINFTESEGNPLTIYAEA
jgi:hypothetical protein